MGHCPMSWSRSSPRRLLHIDHCAIAPSRAVDHLATTRTTTNGATLEQFHELVVEHNVFLLRSNVSTTLMYILRSHHPIFDFFPFCVSEGAVRRLVVGVLDEGAVRRLVVGVLDEGAVRRLVVGVLNEGAVRRLVVGVLDEGAVRRLVVRVLDEGAIRRLVVGVLDASTGLDVLMTSAGILSLVGALVVTGMVLVAETGLVWVAVSTITFLVVLIPEGKAQCKHLNLAYRKKFHDQSLDNSQWH